MKRKTRILVTVVADSIMLISAIFMGYFYPGCWYSYPQPGYSVIFPLFLVCVIMFKITMYFIDLSGDDDEIKRSKL
jgi:uncharacterized membrane protein